MTHRYPVIGRFDMGRAQSGAVLINRAAGTFAVRPHRRRRVYLLPLATVAEIVCSKVIKAELAERRAAKKGRRS